MKSLHILAAALVAAPAAITVAQPAKACSIFTTGIRCITEPKRSKVWVKETMGIMRDAAACKKFANVQACIRAVDEATRGMRDAVDKQNAPTNIRTPRPGTATRPSVPPVRGGQVFTPEQLETERLAREQQRLRLERERLELEKQRAELERLRNQPPPPAYPSAYPPGGNIYNTDPQRWGHSAQEPTPPRTSNDLGGAINGLIDALRNR